MTLRVCGAPAPEIHGHPRRCRVEAGGCDFTKRSQSAPGDRQGV